jgi:hypothetical protein
MQTPELGLCATRGMERVGGHFFTEIPVQADAYSLLGDRRNCRWSGSSPRRLSSIRSARRLSNHDRSRHNPRVVRLRLLGARPTTSSMYRTGFMRSPCPDSAPLLEWVG